MKRVAAVLAFIVIEIVLLPIQLIGIACFMAKLIPSKRRTGVSATAYEPLQNRWMMHEFGTRPDDACDRLLKSLPVGSPLILRMMMGPTFVAMRFTGVGSSLFQRPAVRPSSFMTMFNHRTEFFDNALADRLDGVKQLAVLGAGWDTRAYNLPKGSDVRAFEVDTAKTQETKRAALNEAGVDTSNVTFVAVDFNEESWMDRLKQHGFDPNLPTFFLWEGVTYYLEDEAIFSTLDSVGRDCAAGSVIAFDYFARDVVDGTRSLMYRLGTMYLQASGEPWVFGISTGPPARDRIAELLEAHGLELDRYEAYGEEGPGKRPFGGLVTAVSR